MTKESLPNTLRGALLTLFMHNALACSITVRVKPKNKSISTEGILRTTIITNVSSSSSSSSKHTNSGGGGNNSRNKKLISAEEMAQSVGLSSSSNPGTINTDSGFESTEFGTLRYEFRPVGILRRLHYPRYLQLIENLFGYEAAVLMGSLLYHGIWNKQACLFHAAYNIERETVIGPGNYKNNKDTDIEQLSSSTKTIVHRLTALWKTLENHHFIIKHEGLPAPFPPDLLASPISYTAPVVPRKKTESTSGGAGRKRARTTIDSEEDELNNDGVTDENTERRFLYRFQWETATRYLRNDIIIRYVRSAAVRGNESQIVSAVHVVRACLELTVQNEQGFLDITSAPIPVGHILERIIRNTADTVHSMSTISMNNAVKLTRTNSASSSTAVSPTAANTDEPWTIDRVLKILHLFTTLPTPIVQEVPSYTGKVLDRTFVINYAVLISAIQLRTIENIAFERYDQQGARILRMLLEKGMLDEKIIAERCLLEPKTTRALIFQMVGDGLITTQELPRRPDRQPQYTFYMFNANMDRVLALLAENICKNVLNMRIRMRLELSRLETLQNKLHTLNTTVSSLEDIDKQSGNTMSLSSSSSSSTTTIATTKTSIENIQQMIHHIQDGINKIEMSIVRVDETLLLLSEL